MHLELAGGLARLHATCGGRHASLARVRAASRPPSRRCGRALRHAGALLGGARRPVLVRRGLRRRRRGQRSRRLGRELGRRRHRARPRRACGEMRAGGAWRDVRPHVCPVRRRGWACAALRAGRVRVDETARGRRRRGRADRRAEGGGWRALLLGGGGVARAHPLRVRRCRLPWARGRARRNRGPAPRAPHASAAHRPPAAEAQPGARRRKVPPPRPPHAAHAARCAPPAPAQESAHLRALLRHRLVHLVLREPRAARRGCDAELALRHLRRAARQALRLQGAARHTRALAARPAEALPCPRRCARSATRTWLRAACHS